MTLRIKIAVAGARGHMGHAVIPILAADPAFTYVGSFGRAGSKGDGLIDRVAAIKAADVILDFSTASAAVELAELGAENGGPALVIGATGLTRKKSPGSVKPLHAVVASRSHLSNGAAETAPQASVR